MVMLIWGALALTLKMRILTGTFSCAAFASFHQKYDFKLFLRLVFFLAHEKYEISVVPVLRAAFSMLRRTYADGRTCRFIQVAAVSLHVPSE
jgi:hypothetical protein